MEANISVILCPKCIESPHSMVKISLQIILMPPLHCETQVTWEDFFIFFNWDSLHARLNSHYKTWSYKKKNHKKIRAHRKSV